MNRQLGSDWVRQGLSPHLVTKIVAVDYDGDAIRDDEDKEVEIVTTFLEGATVSFQQHWQSPFESMGPESKAPTLAAMFQSGALAPLAREIQGAANGLANSADPDSALAQIAGSAVRSLGSAAGEANDTLRSIRGRTGLTKMNSSVIYSGSSGFKINGSLYFRAYSDAKREVMKPLEYLLSWLVPQQLSPDGLVIGALTGSSRRDGLLNNLLPSSAPRLMNLRHGDVAFLQVVLESLELPLTAPKTSDGDYAELVLPVVFSSAAAVDRSDIRDFFRRRGLFRREGNYFGRP